MRPSRYAAAATLALIAAYQHGFAIAFSSRASCSGGWIREPQALISPPSCIPTKQTTSLQRHRHRLPLSSRRHSSSNDDETNDDSPSASANPYYDPNYPELEFVNYDDPEYQVNQDDDFFPSPNLSEKETLAEIESMRESRRRRNDEYQFETYHASVLRGGEVTLGEWTVFQTDTFMGSEIIQGRDPELREVPRLLKWDKVLKVVSRGWKVVIDPEAEWRVDGERIQHEERLAGIDDFPVFLDKEEDDVDELRWEEEDKIHVENRFWPHDLDSMDFRGPGGNMCVGKAYTICDAVPLQSMDDGVEDRHEGPFREMRAEVGIQDNGMRFRIKLDYALLDDDQKSAASSPPPLHLRTLTVCRETLDGYWPSQSDNCVERRGDESAESVPKRKNQDLIDNALFGPPGAPGGLYDPPPVGSEERAIQNYMLLNFEGGATVLLPHRMDQHYDTEGQDGHSDSFGWVTSLDWTPGKIRYQVDRKVLSGTKLKGLKTLELSEVRGEDAERWRPRDGGANMRQ